MFWGEWRRLNRPMPWPISPSSPMTVSDLDRWRAAQQLIKSHGLDASLNAAQRADQAIARGDPKGESLWLDIGRKIDALQRANPSGRAH
jgi:hypothetical protein